MRHKHRATLFRLKTRIPEPVDSIWIEKVALRLAFQALFAILEVVIEIREKMEK